MVYTVKTKYEIILLLGSIKSVTYNPNNPNSDVYLTLSITNIIQI